MNKEAQSPSSLILYQTEDGKLKIDVRFEGETVWLSLNQLAALFQRDKSVISRHIKSVFEEGELSRDGTVAKTATVQIEGGKQVARDIEFFNLDVIISVGYRVQSAVATRFRIWATQRLREYIVKGFAMDDERLKNPPGKGQTDYFDELLERVRDIRSSERRFYQKVLDIYATSVDYSPNSDLSQQFFATVQNKMHWAIHGHTAAEIIHERADATQPMMGMLSTRPGNVIRREDASIAKNYLNEEELKALNLIVSFYIEFAEFQALSRKAMTMQKWIEKLDEFLRLSDRDLLNHAGKISSEAARLKAESEYDRYRALTDARPRPVDADFEQAVKQLQKVSKSKKVKASTRSVRNSGDKS